MMAPAYKFSHSNLLVLSPIVTVTIILAIHTKRVLVTSAIDLVKELICLVTFTPHTLKIAMVKIPIIHIKAKKKSDPNYLKYKAGLSKLEWSWLYFSYPGTKFLYSGYTTQVPSNALKGQEAYDKIGKQIP